MKENEIDQNSESVKSNPNQSSAEKKKEFHEKKSGVLDPNKNDPTRNDKPPLIISKL